MWIILKREEKSRTIIHTLTVLFMFLRTTMIILFIWQKRNRFIGPGSETPFT